MTERTSTGGLPCTVSACFFNVQKRIATGALVVLCVTLHLHPQSVGLPFPKVAARAQDLAMADAKNKSCAENTEVDESPCKKQKPDEAAAASSFPGTKGKFKIVGRVVMAMKRFQGG